MTRGVILVGHGGIPKDCPQKLVTKLKRLEARRRAAKTPPSQEERELDSKIRRWPRTAATDPYQVGLEVVAGELRARMDGVLFAVAYNEFCAPTLEESVEELIKKGATQITVSTTMFTPGGSHSEIEIPRDSPPSANAASGHRSPLCLAVRPPSGCEHARRANSAILRGARLDVAVKRSVTGWSSSVECARFSLHPART